MVIWLLHTYSIIPDRRPIPLKVDDGRFIDLLDLYLVVKHEGGRENVTEQNNWALIAKDLGFNWDEGHVMRVIYVEYIDVLEYNYVKAKSTSAVSNDDTNSVAKNGKDDHIDPKLDMRDYAGF
ncbi:putative transcription factor & chromatin remodeling ARID family [Helianthus annuus]|nr:putative transcription factor & chromatin remodeling ARID family [Helianthus annuus]